MWKPTLAAALAGALCLLTIPAAAQDEAAPAPAGDAARGRQVYLANSCHACHGTVGQGGGPGPILAASQLPYEAFAMQMRAPVAVMPAYGERLMSDQDLADVLAYLQSLPGPRETLPDILRD